jgi:hypothetical protein
MDENEAATSPPHYRWPWFVLAAVILGIALAFLWMSVAVRRIREQRTADPLAAPSGTGGNISK